MKFPKRIYVWIDGENDDEGLVPVTKAEDLPNERCKVAVYELKAVKKHTVKHELK